MPRVLLSHPFLNGHSIRMHVSECFTKTNFSVFLVDFWAWKPKNNISIPSTGRTFLLTPKFPYWLRGSQSLLFNGNQGHFSLGKTAGGVKLATFCRLLVPRLRTKRPEPPILITPL